MDVSDLLREEYKNILLACGRFQRYGVSIEQTMLEFERIGTRLHQLSYSVDSQYEFDLLDFVQTHLFNGLAIQEHENCRKSESFYYFDF